MDNSPRGQEPPQRPPPPPPPLPSQQLPQRAEPSTATGTGPHHQTRIIQQTPQPVSVRTVDISGASTFSNATTNREALSRGTAGIMAPIRENMFRERETSRAAFGRIQEFIDPSSQRELNHFSPQPPRAVDVYNALWTQLESFYLQPSPPVPPELWDELLPSVLQLSMQRYLTLVGFSRQREAFRQIGEIVRQTQAQREPPHRIEEFLYIPRGQGQAGFRQEFHYVVPRPSANLPGAVTQPFPSAMDMQNFVSLQDSVGLSRVLQPRSSAPTPAVHPPTPVAPNMQYDLNLPPFSSALRSPSGPGSSSGPASAAGTASSSRLERTDGRGTKRSRENK